MERDRHDAVRDVERLFDAVAVVDVNVNVEHARVVLEQLEDAEHNVVHVAEARALGLLRVVETARPVDGNVTQAVVQPRSSVCCTHTHKRTHSGYQSGLVRVSH